MQIETTTITVTNPTRRRGWGWNYSTTPIPNTSNIQLPTTPYYTGTIQQVRDGINGDRGYKSMRSGGVYTASAWFYNSQRVLRVFDGTEWLSMTDAIGWGLFDENKLSSLQIEVVK